MSLNKYVQFLAKVRPKPPGGSVHNIRADNKKFEISTCQGLYGNKKSQVVVSIPYSRIVTIEYIPPMLMAGTGYCRMSYLDKLDNEQSLKFHVYDPNHIPTKSSGNRSQNIRTERASGILRDLQLGINNVLSHPVILTSDPPSLKKKFLYGVLLFAVLLLASVLKGDSIMLYIVGSLLLYASFTALGVDYVRIHTGWHPLVKIGISVLIFLVVFILFLATAVLLEVLNWF